MEFHILPLSLSLSLPAKGCEGANIAVSVGLFLCLFVIFLLHKRRIRARLPPGPFPWPIVGNLFQLIPPAHRAFKDLADKYGPIFFLRLGSVPTVVVSSSEIAKEFLKTHDLFFASRPPKAGGRLMFFNSKDVVFAPYGDHWRQMRKICVIELLTAKRIESFKGVREEEVCEMIRSIWEASESGLMGVNIRKALSTLTSNTIWRILAGRKFSDDDLGGDYKGFRDLFVDMMIALGAFHMGDFTPYVDWLDLQGIKRRVKKIHKTFNEFVEKIIDDHVAHRMAATSNHQKDEDPHVKDFVDVLVDNAEADSKITRETTKALVLDMFVGGVDTTSPTLEWAMSELLRHPDAMKRLQEEIKLVVGKHRKVIESDLVNVKYLHCVVKETLRL